MNEIKKPTTAGEYWAQRKARDAKRKFSFGGPSPARRIEAIKTHKCDASCSPCCTRFDW